MKGIRLIHRWTGVLMGLFLFISCFTGIFILVGKLIGSYAPIFGWMKTLHRTLYIGDTGRFIIGVATLLVVVEIFTGYFLWYKMAKGQIKAARKRGENSFHGLCRSLSWRKPTKLWGIHIAGGLWSGIPLLLMALTGLTWSFGWYSDIVYGIFDAEGKGNLFHTIASIHTGSFWGSWSRILWLASAILGASLPITGLMIYLRSISKKLSKKSL